ncbi:MAG: succinylglutamate desuccinylase [Gammaproteobacteria bacterium]|nr:MAG: succinylglutamate desuccinylase [Gammaproteobacteria bacterium]
MARVKRREPIRLGGQKIAAGERRTVELGLGTLYNHNPISMPVHVIHGARPGPRLFVCAAVHGDELNGIEVVRRLLAQPGLRNLRGTLMAVPMVNVLGVMHQSRYLPDRRDLNRSFPGSTTGSLAARLAELFMQEIVRGSTHGIDLHTGAIHRTNLPQIRADMDDPETGKLARAFGVPLLIHANLRDGSLREAAAGEGVRMLLYEGGEALRFDERCIRAGLRGVLGVMRALGMLRGRAPSPTREPVVARASTWVRAPTSGILRSLRGLGEAVNKGDVLGYVSDPFGMAEEVVTAACDGLIMGRSNLPLAHEGDALFLIARVSATDTIEMDDLDSDPAWKEEPAIV